MEEEQSLSLAINGTGGSGLAEPSLSLSEDEAQGQSSVPPDLPEEENIEGI